MSKNYLLSDSIISPLGFGTAENIEAVRQGKSGLKLNYHAGLNAEFYTGLVDSQRLDDKFSKLEDPKRFTRLEKMLILNVQNVLIQHPDLDLQTTGLVVATTKGNIDLLGTNDFPRDRIYLWKLAEVLGQFFGFPLKPLVVSNACISGALAIKVANDMISSGRFKNAIVAAGDLVSDFVLSGFNSFQAISSNPCRPFSKDRDGISLGEAAAAMLIGPKNENEESLIKYVGAGTANDANHISGPSRTGEGLYQCIKRLFEKHQIVPGMIDFLSAHGTATIYNDEMEATAFNRLDLENTPVNSFKAYYGHSLGASALIESIITKWSMLNNEVYASLNFSETGTSRELNVIKQVEKRELDLVLKTASGFGGCNLGMLLKKEGNG